MKPNYEGQIVRIHLENFMSYGDIEIRPGYNLNLIIGPNGTGKSSIVCAVLLGLGGKLKTLGRADHLGSFVKSGCDQSCIEIELFEPSSCNVVIKRKISANNESEFMINGKVSTLAKVTEIRKKYNIQIDNLCTFLPQEKVQDFAKLNPQQLLNQTQRIFGSGYLVQLHEKLIELQSKNINQEKHYKALETEVKNEQQKNDRLKDQVQHFKEKQSLCDKLLALKQKLAWLSFQIELEKKEDIAKDTKLAEKIYNEKKKEVDKCMEEMMKLEESLQNYQKQLTAAKNEEASKEAVMEDRLRRANHRIDQLEDLQTTLQTRLEEEAEKKREMLKCKENIEKLTNDLKNLEASIGPEDDLKSQMKAADDKLKTLHAEDARLNQTKFQLQEEEDFLAQEARNTNFEIQRLKERQNIRLEYLKRQEPDVYKAMEWIQKNRSIFQSRIYNPMLLELDVPNPKMAKFIESTINYRDLISFTCVNPDDLNLLVQKLRGEHKWKINVICSDECDSSQYNAEISLSDLRRFGFYGYMKDFINGPEDILRFLCKTYKIHCIPIGDERVENNCEMLPQNILQFYSENHFFTVKYSVYSGLKSINVKKLGESKFFSKSLDTSRIELLLNREKELGVKLKNKRAEIAEVNVKFTDLHEEVEKVKEKMRQLATSTQKKEMIQFNLKRASSKYKEIKESLRDASEIEKEIDEQRQRLQREILKNLSELKEVSAECEKITLSRQRCELQFKIKKLGKRQILENKDRCTEEMTRKEAVFRQMKDRQRVAEHKCMQLKQKAKELTDNISIEENSFKKFSKLFSKFPDTVDELEAEIDETETRNEFLEGGNFQVLQEYEKREEKIQELVNAMENSKKRWEEQKTELSLKGNEWLDPVNELVSKVNLEFAKFFESMGCAGEVSLVAGENKSDFDKYGIGIKVKFRDETPLQDLDMHFQSGGERAVSTAIFMLSLQGLTAVPFRFVDEINQGMDPTNERRILDLVIQVTSQKLSTQYFFITPKLLPDVVCTEFVTVLCIYNGPHAIPSSQWNLKKFIEDLSDDSDNNDDDDNDQRAM